MSPPLLVLAVAIGLALAPLYGWSEQSPSGGTSAAPVATPAADDAIEDNSFLIEEAYNQEPGVVQHIFVYSRSTDGGGWVGSLTDEWPLGAQRHQLSITLQGLGVDSERGRRDGFGDTLLNYRYQLVADGPLWIAPRASVLFPSGDVRRQLGAGGAGLQLALPVSYRISRSLVSHTNAGVLFIRGAEDAAGDRADTRALSLGQSLIWLAASRFNVMLEATWMRAEQVVGPGRTRAGSAAIVSPGVRWAWDFRSGLQIVPGVAVPLGVGASAGERAVLLYLSFEHPF